MRQAAFSLVELALVVVAIGLLMGGIIGAGSLVREARIQRLGKELGALQQAVSDYQQHYGSLPGDTPNASDLFGCTGCNGNGDGHLINADGTPQGNELQLFWEHLSRAKLLSTNYRVLAIGTARAFPISGLAPNAAILAQARLPDRLALSVQLFPAVGGVGLVTPDEAAHIDRWLDDGTPTAGRILAEAAPGGSTCQSNGAYVLSETRRTCNLVYLLSGQPFLNAQSAASEYQWRTKTKPSAPVVGTWVEHGDWSDCTQSCGGGTRTQTVTCTPPATPQVLEFDVTCVNVVDGTVDPTGTLCIGAGPKPPATQSFSGCSAIPPDAAQACNTGICPNAWNIGSWSTCTDGTGASITGGDNELSDWGACSADCDGGTQTRLARCAPRSGVQTRSVTCPSAPCDGPRPMDTQNCSVDTCGTPTTSRACNAQSCSSGWVAGAWSACSAIPTWTIGAWGGCTSACGSAGGLQTRTVACVGSGARTRLVTCPGGSCTGPAPNTSESCDVGCQSNRPMDVQVLQQRRLMGRYL